ncbi:MAG TPA: D-glycerate dehydrogenase [bacterium]|nr:D-glycerate dehydrogenase [bacterium]HOL47301.1 D-glycerate dehydrogenase [bacterium]HPQ17638.1 D-glycerate dehydrogenase [bacterium]
MRKKIFISQKIPEAGINYLKENKIEVDVNYSTKPLKKEELILRSKDCKAIITLLSDIIDKEVIDALAKNGVKGICNYAVGYNNIDVNYAKEKNIYVTNTPDVLTNTTAELAWALLFAAARRIVEAHKFIEARKFTGWECDLFLGYDVSYKNLGVIGAGRIGTAFALMSKGFNMNVYYYDKFHNSELETKLNAKKVDLNELLKISDFISIHLSYSSETKYLISEKEFELMKSNAIIINTARGAIIKEKALSEALKNKKIAYAGLDVFENEPEIYEELYNLDNIVMAPHIGSGTKETRDKMAITAAQNALKIVNNEAPLNPVY